MGHISVFTNMKSEQYLHWKRHLPRNDLVDWWIITGDISLHAKNVCSKTWPLQIQWLGY